MSNLKLFIRGFMKGFRNFSHVITDVVNFIFLLIVYIFGIGPVSIISKAFGKHFMDLKKSGSSWVKRDLKKRPIEEYYRSF